MVGQSCVPIRIAERLTAGATDDDVRRLHRIIQGITICGKRLMDIAMGDVQSDVLTVGLTGSRVVVDGVLDVKPIVRKERPVQHARTTE